MSHPNLHGKDSGSILSSDAKPRLKWTPELHQRFIDAVHQLGGPDKATPKSLMRVLSIHGLTLYHLKSHLQKFRLGKSQQSQNYDENKEEVKTEIQNSDDPFFTEEIQNPINENTNITHPLHGQMEVQRKLYEQIEVQRHLQLRIEAQGKYLQSVLQKAQQTLANYNASASGVELTKAQLSQLASMVDIGCCSSMSGVTELEGSVLGSPESSGNDDQTVLSLMEMQPGQSRKRNHGSNVWDENERPLGKRFQARKFGFVENIDLNSGPRD